MRKSLLYFWAGLAAYGGVTVNGLGFSSDHVRKSAVAGLFYPAGAKELADEVDAFISQAREGPVGTRVVALVAPHAGYAYSGRIAAHAYACLESSHFKRVVVISPSHIEAFQGVSVYDGSGYSTPLGTVEVDEKFCGLLAKSSDVIRRSSRGHRAGFGGRGEHALEVQLPFLQRVLGEFLLVPAVMGDQKYETCLALGNALAKLCSDGTTLIVASSDLSHFHPYEEAKHLDRSLLHAVKRWDYFSLAGNLAAEKWEACGGGPVVATMIAAEGLGANKAQVLKYANSGDIPGGDKSRVVGYAAIVFYRDESDKAGRFTTDRIHLSYDEEKELLGLARLSVEAVVKGTAPPSVAENLSERLTQEAAAFVTLKEDGELRGCVGSIVAVQSLAAAVIQAAASAATKDHRFLPVSESELGRLQFEISVLSPFVKMSSPDQIQIGEHGLYLEKGRHHGLLLPQVAGDRGWNAKTFLDQTCVKAGLDPGAWKEPDAEMYLFAATVFDSE